MELPVAAAMNFGNGADTRGGLDRRLVAPARGYTGAMRSPDREPEP
jgi:hypothetical protein